MVHNLKRFKEVMETTHSVPAKKKKRKSAKIRIKVEASEKDKDILQDVGKELKDNPPEVLKKTEKKKGKKAAEKQRVAILLSKARKRGANIPVKEALGGQAVGFGRKGRTEGTHKKDLITNIQIAKVGQGSTMAQVKSEVKDLSKKSEKELSAILKDLLAKKK